ncbi:MAG: putative toxin-antitoxin system toxin component, PIN family [Anaerolineae bacterium]
MGSPKQLRVFVDANVLIRGITFPRYPYEILRLATRHEIVMVISPTVLADARHYLSTLFPNHLPKLDSLLSVALVEIADDPTLDEVRNHRDLVRDIKDVPVVLAAVKASVDYLVSTDADLTDVDASTEALRLLLEPAKVLRVGTFLHDVMGWSHQALDSISRRRWDEIHGDTWTR